MTGADVVAQLLRADPLIVAEVPIARIKEGRLALDATLPALLVRTISVVDRPLLKRGATPRKDRVAVTVRAASYRDQVAIMKLVRACCGGRIVDVGGQRVSVVPAGGGPDVAGPANSFEQTADFRVSLTDPF